MTIENVDFALLTPDDQDQLKGAIQSTLAEQVGVDVSAVSVQLSKGSIQVVAEIETPPGMSTDGITAALGEVDIGAQIVAAASELPGVLNAATGDLAYSGLLVEMVNVAAAAAGAPGAPGAPAAIPAPPPAAIPA